ncbi:MAG: glycosyltransferase family 39 protein, partial [Candidatus Paceibacterota bacterium]
MPGVQFDEVLHVNAALGGLDGSFIYKSIFDVPVLLMPYIGALKAYITAPVFAIFGVSVFTVRLPMILLAALSLLFLFWANKKYFSIGIATIALWLLAIDPNFIALTRLDSGPVVLGFMMSVLALLFFKKFLKNQKIIFLFLTFAALGLGIFHKLNFVWFINGFIFSALIIYYRELIEILKRKSKSARILIIGLFVGGYGTLAGLFIYASYKFALFGTSSLSGIDWYVRAYNTSTSLMYLLNGELYLNYSLTNYHSVLGIAYFIFAALVILLGLFFAIRDKGRQLKYLPP